MFKRVFKPNSKIEYIGFLGFLGFLGFAKSFQGQSQFIFFAFFGFFSYFIIGHISRETPDERMINNYQRAKLVMIKLYSAVFAVLWVFVVINNNRLHIEHVSMRLIEIIVSVGFAASLIINSFLIYYYEKVE